MCVAVECAHVLTDLVEWLEGLQGRGGRVEQLLADTQGFTWGAGPAGQGAVCEANWEAGERGVEGW